MRSCRHLKMCDVVMRPAMDPIAFAFVEPTGIDAAPDHIVSEFYINDRFGSDWHHIAIAFGPIVLNRSAHAAHSPSDAIRFSIGTPVYWLIFTANGRDGVAWFRLILVIIDRSHPTSFASGASLIFFSAMYSASVIIGTMCITCTVNVKHFVHDIAWSEINGCDKM